MLCLPVTFWMWAHQHVGISFDDLLHVLQGQSDDSLVPINMLPWPSRDFDGSCSAVIAGVYGMASSMTINMELGDSSGEPLCSLLQCCWLIQTDAHAFLTTAFRDRSTKPCRACENWHILQAVCKTELLLSICIGCCTQQLSTSLTCSTITCYCSQCVVCCRSFHG